MFRITPTITPTPLGTLKRLPREIRDEIYDHILDRSYLAFSTYQHANCPPIFAHLGIRHVSRALSAEATARLFSAATVFTFLIRFAQDDRLSPPPAKKVTERMMNVNLVVDAGALIEKFYVSMVEEDMVSYEQGMWGDDIVPVVTANGEVRGRQTLYYPAAMDPRCEASVEHFTGDEIERNSLLVTFKDFDENFHLFVATRFFQSMKKCIGFRNVRVVLEWWWWPNRGRNAVVVMEKVDEVRIELEQCWGPCVVKHELDRLEERSEGEHRKLYFTFELAFQPLKFRAANLKTEGDEVRTTEMGPKKLTEQV